MDAEFPDGTPKMPGTFVPARTIPVPSSISAEAQAFLANPPALGGPFPATHDKEAWRALIATMNALLTAAFSDKARRFPSEIITHQPAAVPVYEVVPASLAPENDGCAIFDIHGGAFVYGAGLAATYMMATPLASLSGVRAFSVDYRMPPDHPFPIGLDDTVEAYRWLLGRYPAEKIVVTGGSAGAGLAASFLLKARNLGLPMPAGCILATPEADLTESGDTFETNDTIDVALKHRLTDTIALYANGHDLRDPYLSPLFGDFSKGFPPTLLTSGTRDLFLSNTVRMHRALLKAGIEAELHVWEAMPHGGFFGAPEDDEVLSEATRFVKRKLRLT